MASIDKLKIMLSIMRELNDGNYPKASDYEITSEELKPVKMKAISKMLG